MAMEQDLKQLLDRNKVHDDATAWLTTIGCTSMKLFANWVDNRNEQAELVGAGVPACKDKRDQLAAL